MRRIVGALILLVSALICRADDISRFWAPVRRGDPAPRVTDTASAPPAARAKKEKTRQTAPPDFRRNPLLFLSSAPKDSLVLLPGVGPVLADRIMSARTGKRSFTRWDDLLAIKGIGPKTIERLKGLADQTNP